MSTPPGVGSPPNFSNLIYQWWGLTEPYFTTLSLHVLDSYWTYWYSVSLIYRGWWGPWNNTQSWFAYINKIEGSLPGEWRIGNISPIHKKGPKTDASNYRPLCLTSIICKIMESFIRDNVLWHMRENDLLSENQHGFLPGCSTITQLLKAMDYWTKALDNGNDIQCLPFYIINEVGHLTTSVDHLAEFCQNYRLAAICTQLMVKFFYN